MGRACRSNGEKSSAYRLLVGNPVRKRQLGSSKHRWMDNIKMDHGEREWGDMNWIGRDQWWALVNALMNFRFP
jgi:hypothetical protein